MNTRRIIRLKRPDRFNWHALKHEGHFLFRRVADRDKCLLFVGQRSSGTPAFTGVIANDWWYGHLQYDLKNELEDLHSRLPPRTDMPLQHWSVPRSVLVWSSTGSDVELHVHEDDAADGLAFSEQFLRSAEGTVSIDPEWHLRTSHERYLQHAGRLLHHIQQGDIYEVNYCIERCTDLRDLDVFGLFGSFDRRSEASFAAFHRHGDHFTLCASPERFLAFDLERVIAQPMKGTRPRASDPEKDRRAAFELAADEKERSENIMALDVARHDLSRVADGSSVLVEELCVVRPHRHVHQMTSTVSARIREGFSPIDVVHAAFPMASMTGAPKIRAMQLIDEYEDQRRGLFSGSLGYFSPDGSADLNVVIRSVLYDRSSGSARVLTGSALTAACDPQKEWEECELKASSILKALRS